MEAYTNIKIDMENNAIANMAAEEAKATIMKDHLYKNDEINVSRFINDIKVIVFSNPNLNQMNCA